MGVRVCWATVLLASLPLAGQQAPPAMAPTPTFRTGVELVLLDVTVLDKDRQPVHDLTAADFTILEDGRPQSIQSFVEFKSPDVDLAEPPAARWVREVAPDAVRNDTLENRPVTVIVLDDATPMMAVEGLALRRMAGNVVDRLPAGDSAAVLFTRDKSRGQEFTADRGLLRSAVDRFISDPDLMTGPAGVPVPFDQFNRFEMDKYLAVVGTLRSIASDLSAYPGRRKTIVFLSVGLPVGAADLGPSTSLSDGSAGASGEVALLIHQTFQLFQAAQRANIRIYSISPGGLRAPSGALSTFAKMAGTSGNAYPGESNDLYLRSVAENTGGFAVVDTNAYEPAILQIHRENSSYYLLGYVPADSRAQGRFRRVQVRTNRAGLTAQTRPGYVEPVASASNSRVKAASAPPKPPRADQAMAGLLPKSDLPMELVVAPFAIPGDTRAALAIALAVRQHAPGRATRVVGHVDLTISAFTPDGARQASRREKADARMSPGADEDVEYAFLSRLDVPPGRYMLRIGAVGSVTGISAAPGAPAVAVLAPGAEFEGKTGSLFADVEVPDFQREPISLSGVVLSASPGLVAGPKDRLASLMPVVPSTVRSFRSYSRVTAFARVYQGSGPVADEVAVSARVVDGDGTTEFEWTDTLPAARFGPRRAADVLLEIPVARFKPGPHLLTIRAARGGKTTSRSSRFDTWF